MSQEEEEELGGVVGRRGKNNQKEGTGGRARSRNQKEDAGGLRSQVEEPEEGGARKKILQGNQDEDRKRDRESNESGEEPEIRIWRKSQKEELGGGGVRKISQNMEPGGRALQMNQLEEPGTRWTLQETKPEGGEAKMREGQED